MLLDNFLKIIISLLTTFNNCKLFRATELQHVLCNKDFITVQLPRTSNHSNLFLKSVYWQNLHTTTTKECQPVYHVHEITFMILFKNLLKCGFQRNINKFENMSIKFQATFQHQISFYQNLFVEQHNNKRTKHFIKCNYKAKNLRYLSEKHKLKKRSALPADFQEDEDIELLETVEQKASEPKVLMEVRQNGDLIDGLVTVIPGTPLVMAIKLNGLANEVYGLKINYLQVTDMAEMSETIIFRGCTVDPYLFDNFNLTKTNSLEAKFRAFKFPTSAFVQFRANVQICLKKCPLTQCITGSSPKQQLRKRRELSKQKDNFHDIHASLVLKFQENFKGDKVAIRTLNNHINLLHIKNLHLHKFK